MSFSSRRRNYLLTPHRRDGLIEWMKSMLMHSFVLDAAESYADTFLHFEVLIEEHRLHMQSNTNDLPSRLKQLVPTVGTFHTPLPLRKAYIAYNMKYALTKRKHICISFNELRHILNLAQVMAMAMALGQRGDILIEEVLLDKSEREPSPTIDSVTSPSDTDLEPFQSGMTFAGPKMITFDGDQTLYSDGANFESNRRLANYLYLLLRNGVTIAVVTAAGYEYQTAKYELRLSGLLAYFKEKKLSPEDCERFYLFGGECNYLLVLGKDFKLHPVKEFGAGGWMTSTKFIEESPANWKDSEVESLLNTSEDCMNVAVEELKIRGRVIRKKRSVGLIPKSTEHLIPREALDEVVIRIQTILKPSTSTTLPFCAFNGGKDVWCDVGNKRVGVNVLSAYLGMPAEGILHIGDQFLNTGNDYAARDICPCVWITSPEETTYILKTVLRLADIDLDKPENSDAISDGNDDESDDKSLNPLHISEEDNENQNMHKVSSEVQFSEAMRRHSTIMDVYTGEMIVNVKK